MASNLIQRPLIFQDENLDVYCKTVMGDKSKSSKQAIVKKGATGLKSRGALNDITNKKKKSSVSQKKKKKKLLVEEEDAVNIEEEFSFWHDHKKCIEAEEAAMRLEAIDFWLDFSERDGPPIVISDLTPEKSSHHCIDSPLSQRSPARSDSSLSLSDLV